jgi:hypothetical protein
MRLGPWLLVGAVVLAFGAASAAAQPAAPGGSVMLPVVGAALAGRPTPVDEKRAGAATATAVAALPVLSDPPGQGVAALLAAPPPAGQLVEVDAYFAGADPRAMRKGRPMGPAQVPCPDLPASILTDRPFPPSYHLLNMWAANMPPESSPWLAAITAHVAQPGSNRATNLPYHARLRGRFGDPRVAHCPRPERVFLVEEVVALHPTQPPPSPAPFHVAPVGHTGWPRHHDRRLGLSVPVPPGWGVESLAEPDVLGGLVMRAPAWPAHPVLVRVHRGESWYDHNVPAAKPPLFQGTTAYGRYEQGMVFTTEPTQGLPGWHGSRAFPSERSESVLFNGGGRTHELVLRYPTGLDLPPQELMTAYTAIVEGFRLDQDPGPTPTPPIKRVLGPGPFIPETDAFARVRQRHGAELELVAARLVPEAEARGSSGPCTFDGHPDGVWVVIARGVFGGRIADYRFYVEATTGEWLCGEPADARPFPTWTPRGQPPTPGPSPTPR